MREYSKDADAMGCVGWRGSGCAVVTRADGARARVMYFSYSLQD